MSSPIDWIANAARARQRYGSQGEPVGAHGFRPDAPYSLCGCVERARAGEAADVGARRCAYCERVAAGHPVADLSYTGRPGVMRAAAPLLVRLDSVKRFAVGSNPLDPLPFTAAERLDLVRRVQAATTPARVAASRATAARWDQYRSAADAARPAPGGRP